MIIDCHSHILPGIDDGAKDVETSLEMLRKSGGQGVQLMVATPHFYAWKDRIKDFIARREAAYESLKKRTDESMPKIQLGAEVAFFTGISQAEQVEALKIEGTDTILLEMPFQPWKPNDIDEVEMLVEKDGYGIILAHIERYLHLPGNKVMIRRLLQLPVKVQVNAESLLDWRQRGKLIRMFGRGEAHLLGSDCHGIHHRPPNLLEGRDILARKLGEGVLDAIDGRGEDILLGR